MNPAIEIKNLSLCYGDIIVLENIELTIPENSFVSIVGPNGAGKTTMMRMIMNIIKPDFGEILYNKEPRGKFKSLHFGYLPEERGLYPKATVLEMLVYFGTLNNLNRRKAEVEAIRYLDRLGIIDYSDATVNHLSKGMQQKVQFIAAFLHDPDVLILDEPFSGLDPINQIVLTDILTEYKREDKILIISTHHMDQAEKLCDHICLMNNGHVVLDGNLKDIKRNRRENAYIVEGDFLSFLHNFEQIEILEENNTAFKFCLKDKEVDISEIITKINKRTQIRRFEILEPSLQDMFIKIIQEKSQAR